MMMMMMMMNTRKDKKKITETALLFITFLSKSLSL